MRTIQVIVLVLLITSATVEIAVGQSSAEKKRSVLLEKEPIEYVDPLIGTKEKRGRGRTFPGVGVPFGTTPWTPDNTNETPPYVYGGATIVRYPDADVMKGFRGTHWANGSFSPEYGAVTLMPVVGALQVAPEARGSRFSHDTEVARPNYYAVTLEDYDVRAELTATQHTGFLQFTFPSAEEAHIVVDARLGGGFVEVLPEENQIVGYNAERTKASDSALGDPRGYFAIEFSKPFSSYGTWSGEEIHAGSESEEAEHPGAYVSFSASNNEVVLVKVGTSFISTDQARKNLEREIPHWNFAKIRKQVREIWNETLGAVQIEGGSEEQKALFYTSLYNVYRHPRIFSENGRYYSVYDGTVHQTDRPWYGGDEGLWDTFRAKHPLLSLLAPKVENDFIRSLLDVYDQWGWIPRWPYVGYPDRKGMIGSHADAVIANAFVRGIRDYDLEKAFQAMMKNAMVPGTEYNVGRQGLQYYKEFGYVPADSMGRYRHRIGGQATARTLEFAYDDFAIAQLANGLGKADEHARFMERAQNWQNVFDPKVGFVRGRNADGSWTHVPFNPLAPGGPFTEATAWHYTWSVQHDVQGLINHMGGREAFIRKLERALEGGQETDYLAIPPRPQYQNLYFWFGNEPVQHAMYLFDYACAPWKTQFWVRDIMKRAFSATPEGYPGDEDTGQLSAWYVFSALGFYPTSPARPTYDIGSPVFEKVVIHLDEKYYDGKSLTIEAAGASAENIYVQSATINGEPLEKPWVTHTDLVEGGTLRFEMGPEPNKKWGAAPEAAPPSISEPPSRFMKEAR